jgi:hypothetical protein
MVLQSESQCLESLQIKFLALIWELRKASRSLKITSFFEELLLPLVGRVVLKESATLDRYNYISFYTNHSDIVNPLSSLIRYPILTRPFGRQFHFRQSSTILSYSFFAPLGKPALFQLPLSRSFTSGAIKTQAILDAMSPATRLLDEYLREGGYQKWGWVIYRSTYQNDEDWDCIKEVITETIRKSIEYHKTPDFDHSLN